MKKNDLTGNKFGSLTVVKYAGKSKWVCICDCGNTTCVKTSNLTSGHTKSCGCLSRLQSAKNGRKSLIDLAGQRFGKLLVQRYFPDLKKWECVCDCGKITYVVSAFGNPDTKNTADDLILSMLKNKTKERVAV